VTARINPATFDRMAIAAMRTRLAALTVDDLDRPSACAGWSIRKLLAHLVGGNLRFALALNGQPVDWASRDEESISSPLREFDESAAQMTAAIEAIEVPDRPVLLPAGEPPASFAVGVHAADMLIHVWDLAVATGQDATLDPVLCRFATAVIEKYPPSFWGAGRFFAERIETASSDPQARLLALTGRNPEVGRQANSC
jgi:uncharacterized protein (TIGR03086 family)